MLDIRIGAPQAHEYLTVFPLLAGDDVELPYALLADAIAAGTLRIGEVGQGAVPTLLAHNSGDTDILVLDGEQLIGSKQNRITNRSMLLGAHSTAEIPVSCMEHGRWHFDSDLMRSAPQHSPAKVRRHARETEVKHAYAGVAASPAALHEGQMDVWASIADTTAKLGGRSATGAMDAVYGANAARLDEMQRAFPGLPGQVGLLAFIGATPIGLDLVGGRTLYARLHPRLLRGYLLDALDRAADRTGASPAPLATEASVAQAYLDVVRRARRVPAPTVGKGAYAVLTGAVIGGELLDGEAVAHLSAFPASDGSRGTDRPPVVREEPLPRPSERRRRPPRIY